MLNASSARATSAWRVAGDVAQPGRHPQRAERHRRELARADAQRQAPERGVARERRELAQLPGSGARPPRAALLRHHEIQHQAHRHRQRDDAVERLRASPARAAAISSGTVAAIAPSMPDANAMPFMVAIRSGGYQSTNAVNEDIRQPETPRPISARASVSCRRSRRERKPHAARRGDQQQRRVHAPRPEAVEQHAQRQLEQRESEEVDAGEQPQAAADRPNSRASSGPITALTVR